MLIYHRKWFFLPFLLKNFIVRFILFADIMKKKLAKIYKKIMSSQNNQESDKEDNNYSENSSDVGILSSDNFVQRDLELNQKEMLKFYSTKDTKRYESFRRSNLAKNEVKKLVTKIIDQTCNLSFQISVSAISKVFVGELVDVMIEIRDEENKEKLNNGEILTKEDRSELKPSHAHEAYRRLYKRIPNMKNNKRRYNF